MPNSKKHRMHLFWSPKNLNAFDLSDFGYSNAHQQKGRPHRSHAKNKYWKHKSAPLSLNNWLTKSDDNFMPNSSWHIMVGLSCTTGEASISSSKQITIQNVQKSSFAVCLLWKLLAGLLQPPLPWLNRTRERITSFIANGIIFDGKMRFDSLRLKSINVTDSVCTGAVCSRLICSGEH